MQIPYDKYVYYDETSPSFLRWKIKIGRAKSIRNPGDVAGVFDITNGYWQITINKKKYRVNRIVYELVNNTDILPKYVIDHFDGNRVNNSISNLRMVKQQKNLQNRIKSKLNTSGFTGVYFSNSMNGYIGNYYLNKEEFASFSG